MDSSQQRTYQRKSQRTYLSRKYAQINCKAVKHTVITPKSKNKDANIGQSKTIQTTTGKQAGKRFEASK